ncbi:dapper homolog 2 [Elephas maximus indicus]|uniref:dapper homolog 2 n=1 Tax=Elephas maximus indicus TaxID=99487 RepID=UPI002116252F|nr:dapper homolog 2 [Elephas maximus indicus]
MLAPGAPGAGWDRRRVGARLRAALAGLQELQVLRERQQARVRGALGPQPPPPGSAAGDPRGQERRLEGALAALKEQLSRLRQQDTGLKTHLDQLDQQISELQLGVRKGASEPPDSDSRPSSGFYELSDAASCSRSTSCASVCSESVSSSLGSLLPSAQHPATRVGEYRPRSADETTVHAAPGPPRKPHLAEGRAEGTCRAWGRFRTRPVSAGDLEREAPAEVGSQRAGTDAWSSYSLSHGVHILPQVMDPKYQSDLVSRSGKEVYLYPSPLHAVALHSPLFTLTKETPQADSSEPPRNPSPGSMGVSSIWLGPVPEAHRAGAYIDKLLQRTRGRGSPLRGSVGEQGPPRCGVAAPQQARSGHSVNREGQLEKLVSSLESKEVEGMTQTESTHRGSPMQPGSVSLVDTQQPATLPEASMPSESYILEKTTWGPHLQEQDAPLRPQAWPSHPTPHYWDDKDDLPCTKGGTRSPSLLWGQLVHTPFAAAPEACPARPKTGRPRVKAAKVKRRMSDRALRFGREGLRFPERQWRAHPVPWLPPEWNPSHGPLGDGRLRGRAAMAGEAPGRSCSETSLYPVPFLVPLVVAQQQSHRASAQALYPLGATPLGVVASGWTRRKQRRWQSSVEISARAHPTSLPAHPGLGTRRPQGRRAEVPQGRPPLPQPGPRARSESQHSEYSAECTTLFHSTIAESSQDEGSSDHTTNCFGDGESSDSEAEGDCGPGSSGPVLGWGTAGPGDPARPPSAAPQPPRVSSGLRPSPVPRLCRVKASRALKKKIRRFQPASLRVMTMV